MKKQPQVQPRIPAAKKGKEICPGSGWGEAWTSGVVWSCFFFLFRAGRKRTFALASKFSLASHLLRGSSLVQRRGLGESRRRSSAHDVIVELYLPSRFRVSR